MSIIQVIFMPWGDVVRVLNNFKQFDEGSRNDEFIEQSTAANRRQKPT
jgi:hypothetical protein